MKKLLFALLAVVVCLNVSYGQDDYVKRPALGVHFFFNDFNGAAYLRQFGLGSTIREKQLGQFKSMTPGLALNYMSGITNHLDISAGIGGSFIDYPIPNHAAFANDNLLLEANLSVNAKMFTDNYWFTPYLTAGMGASKYKGYYAAFLPAGAGLQLNLYDEAYFFINTQYRIPLSDNGAYHLFHSFGVAGTLGNKKEPKVIPPPPPPVIEPPKDRDGDGIVDSLDDCPDVAGLAKFNGCPDSDNDGIADKDDKCPNTPGLARYQGCPIPDRDKDGINDEEDKCPDLPGLARYQGCPIPDRDKDGVNDEEDKCPDLAGDPANSGCPIIKADLMKRVSVAARNIFFTTGKSKLLARSFKGLNDLAGALSEDKDLKLDLDGYTDNTGKHEKNQVLSQDRSDAVKKYLASKGVDENRMTAKGHGQDNPIADNKKAAGRSQNRRVELKLRYY